MAVREFTDERGVSWRAWDVSPAMMVPATKGEDYLAAIYQTGWIVFESVTGGEKRRLSMVPEGWGDATEKELRAMLAKAEAVGSQRPSQDAHSNGEALPAPVLPESSAALDHVIRSFRYPSGRFWTVYAVRNPVDDGAPLLRFTSGARSIDLEEFPRDWADYSPERLSDLLRRGAPRLGPGVPPPGVPGRRWTDRPGSNA